jgi:hypothetical protein
VISISGQLRSRLQNIFMAASVGIRNCVNVDPDPACKVRIQGVDDPENVFLQKLHASMTDIPSYWKCGNVFSPQKNRQQSAFLNSSFLPFFFFVGHLPIRTRIQPTDINMDPDPQHCWKKCAVRTGNVEIQPAQKKCYKV